MSAAPAAAGPHLVTMPAPRRRAGGEAIAKDTP